MHHWHPYLWGRYFVIDTNHYALKFLLDQRLSTIPQHHWVSKLFGYDFSIEFGPGRLNTIADTLSHHGEDDASLRALSGLSFKLYDDFRWELLEDATLCAFCDGVITKRDTPWRMVQGLVRDEHVFVLASSAALPVVLQMAHSVGRKGIQKTLQCLR